MIDHFKKRYKGKSKQIGILIVLFFFLFHSTVLSAKADASEISFTPEEREFIESSESITVGVMTDRSPLSYQDENGQLVGMIPDLLKLISEISGLKFEYRFLKLGQTGYDFLANKEGDLVAGVAVSDFSTPNNQLIQSKSLQTSSIVFVGREGDQFDVNGKLTVALPAAFIRGAEVVSKKYPQLSIL